MRKGRGRGYLAAKEAVDSRRRLNFGGHSGEVPGVTPGGATDAVSGRYSVSVTET